MTDRYTKLVLTIIAVCLVVMVVRDIGLVGKAGAQRGLTSVSIEDVSKYAFSSITPIRVSCENCR
jgi:hypothetical protein